MTLLVLVGPQPLSAECVSATVADQVFYSCSGVLTVVPKGEEKDSGLAHEKHPAQSDEETERPDGDPSAEPGDGRQPP
ncbi:hypothetical protein THITH_03030 [Thioalkalivibrio paradoxus ARh 1]|uniref:Uncharacterized protein n=1 Tax=Thioalkalivibrio paradoxus ARh 1 TaxID=713585 RepID=W0DSP9_9GAMM|nr:hypothetical protein THITH_03030 [Thioalkalivibrio paradoxus ARh 1]